MYKQPNKRGSKRKKLSMAIFAVLLIYLSSVLLWPLPAVKPEVAAISFPEPASELFIPSYGQAALAAPEEGVLASSANQKPTPIASIAKLVTALVVLQEKPLDGSGPPITDRKSTRLNSSH